MKKLAAEPTRNRIPITFQCSSTGMPPVVRSAGISQKPRNRIAARTSSQKNITHFRGRWSLSQPAGSEKKR